VPLLGFQHVPCSTPSDASTFFINWIYTDEPPPDAPISNATPKQVARNNAIIERHRNGESVPDLAKAHGISEQRIHQILRGRRK